MTRNEQRITALVLGGVLFLFLFRLGALGFFDPDEGRYAAIPTAMLRTGDFVVPYLQGFPYLEKPPLLYWLTAGTIRVFGHNEFAARLPVALTGFAGVAALFQLARRTLGLTVAWVSAGLLALNMQWFIQARFLTTDMLLAALLTVGMCLFYEGYATGKRRWYLLFYACVGLATLTKGIIGFLLPGMIVFLFIVLTRQWRLFRDIQLPLGAVIGAAIVVPWFVLVQQRFPDFLRYFIYDQHVARYVAENAEHEKPFWFFVPVMVAGFFPWICYVPFLRRRDRDAWSGHGDGHHLNLFLWLWFLVIFVFFSVSKGKLISYVLPACPPLAMLTAEFVARAFATPRERDVVKRIRRGALVVALIWIAFAPAALVGMPWLVVRDGRMNLADVATWPYIFAAVWGAGGLLTLVFAIRGRVRSLLGVQAAVTAAVFFTMMGAALAIEPFMNPKPLGVALKKAVKPGDLVVIYKIPQPSVEFYLGYPPMLVAFAGEYKYGISLQPNPALFQPDEKALDALLHSDRRVYFVADKDSFKPSDVTAPIEVVASTTKRVVYRNKK